MTAQDIDRIECAIRHIQTAVDVDPWAVEIAVEAMKAQLSAEGTTSDLISRQETIDAIVNKVSGIGLHDNSEVARYGATFRQHEIIDIIESLPSAHSEIEERKEESAQNVPKEDLISRKAAIDALMDFDKKLRKINWYQYPHTEYECRGVDEAIVKIENVPSAQPERKKGKWTKDCACEICGFKPWYERDIHTLSFCPNCGADMREETDAV